MIRLYKIFKKPTHKPALQSNGYDSHFISHEVEPACGFVRQHADYPLAIDEGASSTEYIVSSNVCTTVAENKIERQCFSGAVITWYANEAYRH